MGQLGQSRNPRSQSRLARSRPDGSDSLPGRSISATATSLAHELPSDLDPTYTGGTARALADEFGLDLDDQDVGDNERYDADGDKSGDDDDNDYGRYMVDRGVDDLMDRLDAQFETGLADPFDLGSDSLPVQGQSLGDELAHDAFDPCPSDHQTPFLLEELTSEADGEDAVGNKERLASRNAFGDSIYSLREPSSFPCSPISTSSSSSSSSSLDSIGSTPSSSSSSLSSLLSQILLPPSFLPLLRKDDQSFLLESASKSFALKIEASAKQREGMNLEWDAFDRGERNRFVGGLGYRSVDLTSLTEDLGESADSVSSSTLDGLPGSDSIPDGFSSPAIRTSILSPTQSIPTPTRSASRLADSHVLGDDSFSPSSSPPRSPPSLSFYTQSVIRRVEELRFLTDSLISSLSTVGDTSQITLSAATEAGRRLRSIRTTLGGMKSEEASWERSKEEIQSWEEQEEKRIKLKAVMRTELDGFKKAMEDFEARTTTIRTTHENFLRGTSV